MPTPFTLATPGTRSTAHELMRWCTWPLALTIAAAAAWLLHRHPEQAMALQMATMLAAVLLAVLAERMIPLRRDWQQVSRAERRTDITSMAVLMLLADPIVKRGLLPLVATIVVPLIGTDGTHGWFPEQWPLVVQLLLAAVIAEAGQYAVHRPRWCRC